ncbi:MAG: DUF2554 family protein [Escherichia coli]|nr:DUF2554 family protein [Escherichia coli]
MSKKSNNRANRNLVREHFYWQKSRKPEAGQR